MTAEEIFLERSRYYLSDEYLAKIRHCVAALPDDQLWARANETSNSIANLLLHLAGNIRQWIVGGVGGQEVHRDRASEFSARDGATASELFDDLAKAVAECDAVLARVKPAELTRECKIQGRDTTVLAAIYHVVEHFAMHTGQIVLMTKSAAPGAIHFYEDAGGKARPLWGGKEGMRETT
ncbi:MAG TPA: DinB family protein [Gemmatimonadaceae bacterium]|nr:DinB family protein [Gemmatimonadaceae bacterium]